MNLALPLCGISTWLIGKVLRNYLYIIFKIIIISYYSSAALRRKLSVWDDARMRNQNLGHCEFLYERVIENLQIFKDLSENSGCEANRRLRRFRDSCNEKKKGSVKKIKNQGTSEKNRYSPSGVLVIEKPIVENSYHDLEMVLFGSILTNAIFVVIFVVGILYFLGSKLVSKPTTRNDFEFAED